MSLFEAIFDAAAIGVVVADADGLIIRSNRAFHTILGYSEAELDGQRLGAFTHPDDANAYIHTVTELLADRRASGEIHQRYIRRDGGEVHAQLTVSRIGGDHLLAIVRDVTAERETRADDNRLIQNLTERIKELHALHEAARLLDRSDPPLVLLERFTQLLPPAFQYPADTAARVSYGTAAIETHGYRSSPLSLSTRFATSDGTTGAIEVVYLGSGSGDASPFLEEERALLATLTEMVRIRIDRRLAQDRFQHSQEQLGIVLSAVDVGYFEWDAVRDEMLWSEEMSRLCGLAEDPLLGRFGERLYLVHPDDQDELLASVHRALADTSCRSFEGEFRIIRPDGSWRWMLGKGYIFRNESGRALRMLGVLIDISRLRRLQEQFLQAQKMEAVGQFAGGIAHDFNNMLMVISGYCDLMQASSALPDSLRDSLDEIGGAAERAASLAQQLLTFSRKGSTTPQVLDTNDAMSRLAGFVRPLAGPHTLRLALGHDVAAIRIDERHLGQAVMNLVVNARDAMPAPGVITLTTASTETGGVAIGVSDTGVGMDEATRAQIFDPFFTTKPSGQGTGLGLAVVLSVAQEAFGEIRVDTAPGRGTTVELRFPRAALGN